jgi:Zn-dependent protease with chaperone function
VASQGGYSSSIYVYYLPAIAAFSVAFPRWLTGIYVLFLIVVYWIIASISPGSEQMIILIRLLMIAAVAFCGSLFLAIERSRRQEASKDAEGLRLALNE